MTAVSDRRDRGVTLVELMISMALMGLVVAIVAATLGLAQRTTNRIESSSNAIDAARLVSATLDRELRSAVCIKEPVPNQAAPTERAELPNGCIAGRRNHLRDRRRHGRAYRKWQFANGDRQRRVDHDSVRPADDSAADRGRRHPDQIRQRWRVPHANNSRWEERMGPMLKSNRAGSPEAADRRPRDRGSALVMAAIISVIVFALGGVLFSFANRQSSASNGDRQRQQAIDAASAGLVDAASKLTTDSAPGSYSGTYDSSGSSYEVTVTPVAGEPFRKMLTSVGSSSDAKRTMQQVVEMVPVGFTYGFFTQGTVDGANWTITGKVYIGGDLNLPSQAKTLTGDVYVVGNVDGGKANFVGSLYANGTIKIGSVDSVNDVASGKTIDIYIGRSLSQSTRQGHLSTTEPQTAAGAGTDVALVPVAQRELSRDVPAVLER